jgi:hypothetical protein
MLKKLPFWQLPNQGRGAMTTGVNGCSTVQSHDSRSVAPEKVHAVVSPAGSGDLIRAKRRFRNFMPTVSELGIA